MRFTVCPFCGVASESAHNSQQACIEALQAEIDRTREVLTRVGERSSPERPRPDPPVESGDSEDR